MRLIINNEYAENIMTINWLKIDRGDALRWIDANEENFHLLTSLQYTI